MSNSTYRCTQLDCASYSSTPGPCYACGNPTQLHVENPTPLEGEDGLSQYAIQAWVPTDSDPKGKQVLMDVVPLSIAKRYASTKEREAEERGCQKAQNLLCNAVDSCRQVILSKQGDGDIFIEGHPELGLPSFCDKPEYLLKLVNMLTDAAHLNAKEKEV